MTVQPGNSGPVLTDPEMLAELATADSRLPPRRRTKLQALWRILKSAPLTAWCGMIRG